MIHTWIYSCIKVAMLTVLWLYTKHSDKYHIYRNKSQNFPIQNKKKRLLKIFKCLILNEEKFIQIMKCFFPFHLTHSLPKIKIGQKSYLLSCQIDLYYWSRHLKKSLKCLQMLSAMVPLQFLFPTDLQCSVILKTATFHRYYLFMLLLTSALASAKSQLASFCT